MPHWHTKETPVRRRCFGKRRRSDARGFKARIKTAGTAVYSARFESPERQKVGVLLIWIGIGLLFLLCAEAAQAYTSLVAFGDSYTDTGRAPSSPPAYWNGRFSNGPLWIEDLSVTLGFAYNPVNNYAVSGSESDELGIAISQFPGTSDSANVLFAIWSGSNDIANHLNLGYDDSAWTVRLNRIISSLMTASDLLYRKGARQLLLMNQMDLTRSPQILNTYGPTFRSYIQGKIQLFNSQLSSAIPSLTASHPGLRVFLVDIYGDFNYLLDAYQALGFTKETIGAINDPSISDDSFYGPGANYVFWDSEHPTAKTHALMAGWVAAVLPSPAPPPTVAITLPQNTQFTAPANLSITAAVSANGWPISQVALFNSGTLAASLSTSPYVFNLVSLPIGSYTFTAQVTYGAGQTVSSTPVQISVGAPPGATIPPPPWTNQDIGAVGEGGGAYYITNGSFFVTGSGSDIWDAADAFQFVWQPFSGDGSITAEVTELQDTDGYAKAGVMLRETLDPGARNVMVLVTPTSGTGLQDRLVMNGTSSFVFGSSNATPFWLRLQRQGSNFVGYGSADGVSWTNFGSVVVPMSTNICAGLAVSSHNNALLNSAVFANVTVSHPAPPPPPPPLPPAPEPAVLDLLRVTNGSLQLNISGSTGATYVCQISTNLVNWFPISTNQVTAGAIRFPVPAMTPKSYNFLRAVASPASP